MTDYEKRYLEKTLKLGRELFFVCLGLIVLCGLLGFRVVQLEHRERTRAGRDYMTVQAAYYDGMHDAQNQREGQ